MRAGNCQCRRSGFTLIELLVTIAVAVILATVAVPGFQQRMASNRMASDYNAMLVGLNYARAEAIKRRIEVSFEVTEVQPWRYEVYYGPSGQGLRVNEGRDERTFSEEVKVVFNSLGRAPDCPCEILLKDSSGRVGDRQININSLGRVWGGAG